MGVEVKELPVNNNGKPVEDEPGRPVTRRRALVARKDFVAGEVIYKVSFSFSISDAQAIDWKPSPGKSYGRCS